ncbi:MAG: preprotein translocase subunit SecG [Synergistaceae bacterium]|nr:preprotein translocase subunit SecG [Synergistaceae bacterium]
MFKTILSVLFLFLCIGLICVILLQHRKSGGFSGSFGGGGTQMDMSGGTWQRMSSLNKITFAMTLVFIVLSIILVKMPG